MVPANQANRTTSGAVAIDRDDTHLRRPSLRLGGGLIDLHLAVLGVLFPTGMSVTTVSPSLALAHSEEVEARGFLIVGLTGFVSSSFFLPRGVCPRLLDLSLLDLLLPSLF